MNGFKRLIKARQLDESSDLLLQIPQFRPNFPDVFASGYDSKRPSKSIALLQLSL